jgi:hypothetical protein
MGVHLWVSLVLAFANSEPLHDDRSSNKMPIAVKEAIAQAVQQHGALTAEEAKLFVDGMVKDGRLIEECWS